MAQAPIGLASISISTSTSSHDITIKLKFPPPRNGKTYDKEMQNGYLSEGNGSHSEKTRGETSQTQSIGVNDIEITNENTGNEEWVENNDTEIGMIQSELVLQEEALIRTAVRVESESSMKLEIVRSIVYGGLTELIASLGIVTSASITKDTPEKVVAVSVASLVVRMFVMVYKISELWMKNEEEPRDEGGISYKNALGDRQNYQLHFTVAILSFVVFGLVPPLVYGFTFNKFEKKILDISAVTVVSVFCIALLANGKAYTQRPSTCAEYVIIVGKCIGDTIGTSALTTYGGNLIENFIEQIGGFSGSKRAPAPA